ncbi:MAG TPA: hybrid sensor histidine kinase/response regulator [Anaerolineae bacterium]|nr:hybrid sensor histidine kinase/response regulator [Anaerolineae bacterium]
MHTPIVDHNGQTIAVLGSPVVFDTLIAAISGDFSDIDSTHIYIFDRDGTALFSPTYDPLPLDTNLRERVSEVETRQDHVIKTPNEVQYIIGNAEIESLGWGVIIEQPLSDVLRPTLRVRNSAIVIILIISTVGLLGGFYFVNRLTQPLRELVPAAYALGEGHFDTPKPKAEAGTEVGILVEAFSNMRSAIRSRENALRQSEAILREERGQLALRVKERTHDLELANSELAEAVKSRDEFVSTMSHELRTPLNIILGLSEALARGVYQPIPVQQKKVVENIISSGETLLSMVENVLNLAKAQSGELVARREQVNLTELCGDIVNNYKVIGAKKSISLKYDETKCSDIFVQIDRIQVKQILKELLSNAVKFTDEGGQIGVEVRQDRVEKMVRIIVWDTGIGIEADALDLIFKPFQQLDTRLAREHGGTGLGLALAKQFALLNGGDISAESIPNHGSRFTLTLPVSSRSANRQKTKNGHIMVDEKHSTILLAEDNELGAQTFTDYLEFYGYLVIPARNGLEVLAFVEQEIPDLILMDVQMPKMDGLECMRRLRAQSSTATVPIIALTGMAMHKDEQQCLAAGANEYLSKPISLRLLQERIEVYLGGKNDKTLPKKHEFHE